MAPPDGTAADEAPNGSNTALTLSARMAGHRITDIRRREYDWLFRFSSDATLATEGPWRILIDNRIALCNADDGQRFGLRSAIDCEEGARGLLMQKAVQSISIRNDTGDLSLIFDGGTILEALNMSSGYESWNLGLDDTSVIARGGGELAIFKRL